MNYKKDMLTSSVFKKCKLLLGHNIISHDEKKTAKVERLHNTCNMAQVGSIMIVFSEATWSIIQIWFKF